jgi:hypothetical protein
MKTQDHTDAANDVRCCAYCPAPDRRVRRAVDRLLNEPDQARRGEYAAILLVVLVFAIMLCGVVW